LQEFPIIFTGDNLESVTLIDQVLLAFSRIKHFLHVAADQRTEKGIKGGSIGAVLLSIRFWTQNDRCSTNPKA
jgi:hypothetical protein